MQKKYFLLVVVSLAVLSTVWFVARGNMNNNFVGSMMGRDLMYGDEMMEDDFVADSVVSQKMMLESEPIGMGGGVVEPMMGIMPPYYGDDALDVTQRSYEQSSYHSVVVDDVAKYIRSMKEYFSSVNGIVLNSSINSGDKYDSASLYVKVPVDKFDEATGRVTEDVKKVIDESVSAYDITGQVVNTQDTVVALQEQKSLKEAQLKDAKTEVEKTRIQIEIDRLDRQIANAQKAQENVETRTQYASLSLTAADSEKYFNPGSTGDFEYEFQRAWESLKTFIRVLAVFGIWMIVYSIIWAPVVWIVNKIVRKFKK